MGVGSLSQGDTKTFINQTDYKVVLSFYHFSGTPCTIPSRSMVIGALRSRSVLVASRPNIREGLTVLSGDVSFVFKGLKFVCVR